MGSNVKDSKITPNKISLFTGSLVTNEITTIVQYKNMESIFFAFTRRLGIGCFLVAAGAYKIVIINPTNAIDKRTK